MKKFLMIIGGIGVLGVMILVIVSVTSEKMVCKSKEGNITIMYNNNGITAYAAKGIAYNLDEQQVYAKKIGINSYLDEFSTWFKNNTSGTCEK